MWGVGTPSDVFATLGYIQLVLAVIVPILVYYANYRLLGGRVQFRVLAFLCVALTGLILAIYTINNVLPLIDASLEAEGRVEDTDSYVLGGMMSGIYFGILGTIPTAIFHALRKKWARQTAEAGSCPNITNS